MLTFKESEGRRETRRNRVLCNEDHARASLDSPKTVSRSQTSTNPRTAISARRSGNRYRHSRRRTNYTYMTTPEFLQPDRVFSSAESKAVTGVSMRDNICPNLIHIDENPLPENQDASVGSIRLRNRNTVNRAETRRNSVIGQIVDLCSSEDASSNDSIVAATGRSNESVHKPLRKRSQEVHEIRESPDNSIPVFSTDGMVEPNSSVSVIRHPASFVRCSRPRTSRFRKNLTEDGAAIVQQSRNVATNVIVVDDLSSPSQSTNETSRLRSIEDQETLTQMAADERLAKDLQRSADERLARELQGSYYLGGGAHEHDDAHLARMLQDEENSGILSDHNVAPDGMHLLQEVEALADLEDTSQENLIDGLELTEVDRDFNEDDYEMLLALDDNDTSHGAAQTKIELFPIRTLLWTDVLEEICSVCLELPVAGEVLRRLPCMHEFHQHCIDTWLRQKAACPVCKVDINAS